MTGDQIVELELKTRELVEQLKQDIAKAKESAAPVQLDSSIGRLSRQDSLLQQEIAKDALRRMELRLTHLEEALNRMDEGTYGFCTRCSEDIEYERLEAKPEAVICEKCAAEK